MYFISDVTFLLSNTLTNNNLFVVKKLKLYVCVAFTLMLVISTRPSNFINSFTYYLKTKIIFVFTQQILHVLKTTIVHIGSCYTKCMFEETMNENYNHSNSKIRMILMHNIHA